MENKCTNEALLVRMEASLVARIAHLLGEYQNKVLEPYGITGKQAVMLSFLLRNSGKQLTQRDFEREFDLRSSTINSVLNYLEKGGFLKRIISETDGRAKNVKATPKGEEMRDVIVQMFRSESTVVIKGFTEEEQMQFRSFLFRVLENIQENQKRD